MLAQDCAWIRIIHVYEDECRIPAKLLRNVHILDELYPKIKIDLVLVPGTFSPDIIDYLSQQLEIPKVRDLHTHTHCTALHAR